MCRLNSKLLVLVSALILAIPISAQAYEPFYIENYNVSITVDEARVHSVREDIGLVFTSQSHGIVREIPLSSSQEPYKIDNVASNVPFSLTEGNNVLGVRLGSGASYVYGPTSYTLSYDILYEKDADKENDIVYVTPIGTEWDTTIENASVSVTLPTDEIKSVEVYRGGYGEKTEVGGARIDGNVVRLDASSLQSYEGLTLYIRLPEGVFSKAPRSLTPTQDALVIGLIAVGAFLAALALFFWFRIGHDDKIVPTVEFYAPDDMNPAELSYIVNRGVNTEAISAMIFFWASKGYIKYTELQNGGFELEKLSPIGSDRPTYEKEAFEALFALGEDGKVTNRQIETGYFESAQNIIVNVEESFHGKRAMEEEHNKKIAMRFLLASLLAPALYALLGVICEPISTGAFAFAGLFPPIITFVLSLALIQRKYGGGAGNIIRGVLIIAAVVFMCMIAARLMETRFFGSVVRCLCLVLFASLTAFAAALINRRTDYATNILGRCVGFRNFLKTAEKDRIEALVNENPSYFFDTLPFAVVLGVTDVWASKFEGLIKSPPSWYSGYAGYPFTPYIITNTAMSAAASLSRVYSQRAVKNSRGLGSGFGGGGFSGGGFSGGGGGGGGGHAW